MRTVGGGVLLLIAVAAVPPPGGPAMCTYQTFTWSATLRRSVQRETVRHAYAELLPEETDRASGCTVCAEDQETIELAPLPPFRMCRRLAAGVRRTLARLLAEGQSIRDVQGYRVGRTRGDVDQAGRRTAFSNHSYGVALDINAAHNGLYDRCVTFGPACRLLRGGPWRPGAGPEALTADGAVVRAFRAAGFRWGGEIAGVQKDFMHFSPTGY